MSHELSHNPVKIRIIDLKKNAWKKTIVFIGTVEDKIANELNKVAKAHNAGKPIPSNSILKSFYGANWQTVIGLPESIKGGGHSKQPHEFDNLISSLGLPDADDIIDNDENYINEDNTNNDIDENNIIEDNVNEDIDNNNVDEDDASDVIDISPNIVTDAYMGGDEEKDDTFESMMIDDFAKMEIPNMGLDNVITLNENEIAPVEQTKVADVLEDKHEKTETIDELADSHHIEFIYTYSAFPSTTMFDLKYKIYVASGIPPYRQHLWLRHKERSIPMFYEFLIDEHIEHVEIETLASYYNNQSKDQDNDKVRDKENKENIESKSSMTEIENIPINMNYYSNRDYIKIIAKDEFNLVLTNYHKYDTTEYYLVDLNSLINPAEIYKKIGKEKAQQDMIYYGFICVYFPMITHQVFNDYLKNEANIDSVYPALKPYKATLRDKYMLENQLSSEAYFAKQAMNKKNSIANKLFSSIKETIISINNSNQDVELLLILRNLFDVIELNETVTYCKANLLHQNQNIVLRKSYMGEREPRDIIPLNSLLIKIKIAPDVNENIRLVLFKSGNYVIHTEWREENHMTFDKIIKTVSSRVNPVINQINKMGNRVKHFEIQIPILEKENAELTETSMVLYYDDDLTDARFKLLKTIVDDFRKADFLQAKESTSITDEYFFNYGIYKFDATRFDKVITLSNHYDYVSNGLVSQKWDTIFRHNRLLTISNVASKLRISINGLRDNIETSFFHLFLLGLLSVYQRNAVKVKVEIDETIKNKSMRMLKNLKTQDPILYDFKKIYKSNVIYSKICQKPYQPLLLNEEEYQHLTKEKKSKAIKYWNFTKQKPAWYSCPNPKYPYIKFIVKQHPKDFCIPCCKKIAMNENVNIKKQEIHNRCMSSHQYTGEKINLTKGSHYIATYGKNIEVGRISRLPEHTLEPLFFDTYSPEGIIDPECVVSDGYYLLGVDQHLPAIKDVGYLYCLIHALNMSLHDFITNTTNRIKQHPDKFRVLLDGNAGLYFTNYTELCNTLIMLPEDAVLPNKFEMITWNQLFMSIAYYYYGINTILFDDQQKEAIEMILPVGLKTVHELFPENHKNLVILRKKTKYYPVYLLNTEIFKRTGIIDTRLFLNESGLITIIKAVVRQHFESTEFEKIKSYIDLAIIKNFVEADPTLSIVGYFINYSNLCYAVLVDNVNKTTKDHVIGCYIPIHASHYSLEKGMNLIFQPYDDSYCVDYYKSHKIYELYNKWVHKVSSRADLGNVNIYPLISVEKWISVKKSDSIIGFVSNHNYHYHKALTLSAAKHIADVPIQTLLYSPIDINNIIYSIKSGKTQNRKNQYLENKLQKSIYNYYLYDLLLLQLVTIFNKQRNQSLRKKIITLLAKTNFDKDTKDLKTFIDTTITDTEDVSKIKKIIGRYITTHKNKKQMLSDFDEAYFNFDRVELEKLKKMSHKEVVNELRKLTKTFTVIDDITKKKSFTFPNMIMACTTNIKKGDTYDYCSNNKFIITQANLNQMIEILAYDIINPAKWKWLFNSLFIDRTVDFFKFIRRANETITVEFVEN